MPNDNPPRSLVKPQVCEVLASTSRYFGIPRTKSEIEANENWSLRVDLGLIQSIRLALSKPYTDISQSYPEGLNVTRSDAAAALTVEAAIDLVHKRSNGDKS